MNQNLRTRTRSWTANVVLHNCDEIRELDATGGILMLEASQEFYYLSVLKQCLRDGFVFDCADDDRGSYHPMNFFSFQSTLDMKPS
eukprot:g473.t1